MPHPATIFTIPSHLSFVDALALGLWQRVEGDHFRLGKHVILLPTRRACHGLREAFLRLGKGKAALLPRMIPLGDLDDDEFAFAENSALAADIPPAMPALRRQMLLTRLIATADSALAVEQAAQLAGALADLLDEVQTEQLDFSKLAQLVPEDYAEHWQETLEFLKIITTHWPRILAEEGGMDPAARRNLVLQRQAAIWRAEPPDFPVIAAGSTGSIPATADLLAAVAYMPQGVLVLPGLDRDLDDRAWKKIGEHHPQFTLKRLLDRCGATRADVKIWPTCPATPSARTRLLNEAMRPAETTEMWRHLDANAVPADAVEGLCLIETATLQEEASVIALLIRKKLEIPDLTIALVTNDRALAERVRAALLRWNIEANDSAGQKLTDMPGGNFIRLALAAAHPQAGALEYLSLLKHPLAAGGCEPRECRHRARLLEKIVWRGPRRNGGLVGASLALAEADARAFETPEQRKALMAWLDHLATMLRPLANALRDGGTLPMLIDALIRSCESLATSADMPGALRLWHGDDGEAAANWLHDWHRAAHDFPRVDGAHFPALFEEISRCATVRPRYGQHPRVQILGLLEARLIHADVMILGEMNEASWPPESTPDPWMSRPMREAFGLSTPERRIGFSAHDFVQFASAPEIYMTRAARLGTAPAVPSRFLLRLDTVLRSLGLNSDEKDVLQPDFPWLALARALDRPDEIRPMPPPAPHPPGTARPRAFHVTDISLWRRNPYGFYAKRILRLNPLDPLDADPTAASQGNFIHEILDRFTRDYPMRLPALEVARQRLLELGRAAFAPVMEYPAVGAFWWPKFEQIVTWFLEAEQTRRADYRPLATEIKGEVTLTVEDKAYTLIGRPDRIDLHAEGLAIVDYKTGGVPSPKEITCGFEPQLALLGLMAMRGAFPDTPANKIQDLAYWKLAGRADEPDAPKSIATKTTPDDLIAAAEEGLRHLIATYANPHQPYLAIPQPNYRPAYDDYEHLARIREWSIAGGEDG